MHYVGIEEDAYVHFKAIIDQLFLVTNSRSPPWFLDCRTTLEGVSILKGQTGGAWILYRYDGKWARGWRATARSVCTRRQKSYFGTVSALICRYPRMHIKTSKGMPDAVPAGHRPLSILNSCMCVICIRNSVAVCGPPCFVNSDQHFWKRINISDQLLIDPRRDNLIFLFDTRQTKNAHLSIIYPRHFSASGDQLIIH